MADQLQLRGGTTNEHSTFTGALREVTVDTDKDTLIVHDAATAGGHPLLREDGSNSALALGSQGTPSLKFTGDTNTGIYSPGADQVAISTGGSGRLFVDASGRVGVGGSPTAYQLESRVSGNNGISINNSGNTGTDYSVLDFTQNGAQKGVIYTNNNNFTINAPAGPFYIQTNGSNALVIDSSQRVGIGTSSPQHLFHVVGGGSINNNSANTIAVTGTEHVRLKINTPTTGGYRASLVLSSNEALSGTSNEVAIATTGSGEMRLFTGGSDRVTINSSGNVGVGTTSPGALLEVQGADTAIGSNGTILVKANSAGADDGGQITLGSGNGRHVAVAGRSEGSSGTAGYLQLGVRGSSGDIVERLRIDSSGRVGVGTSSPGQKLTVVGADALFDNPGGQFDLLIGDGNARYYGLRSPAGAANLQLRNHTANTTIATFTSGGNVGVGTTSPAYELEVAGSAAFGANGVAGQVKARRPSDGLVGGYFGYATTGSNDLYIANASGSQNIIAQTNVGAFIFNSASATERFRIDSSGRVGIGTSSPLELLHLKGSAGNSFIRFTDSDGSSDYTIGADDAVGSGGLIFYDREASAYRMVLDSSGRLGIGTTSPIRPLSVSNGGAEGFEFGPGDGAGYNLTLHYNRSTSAYIGSVNQASYHTWSAGTASEKMRLDTSGRLLVGTSSSATSSTAQYALLQVKGHYQGSSAEGIIDIQRGESSSAMSSSDKIGNLLFTDKDGGDYARIEAYADATPGTNDYPGRLVFSTTADGASSPTERMRIRNDGTTTVFSEYGLTSCSSQSAGTTRSVFEGLHSATSTQDGTLSFRVFTNGNVVNTNNSYGAISDIKLKENIVDASSQWDDLKSIQVRNYNFKEGQTHTQIGVVAQEVELVSPGLVTESPDKDDEGNDLGTVTKSVNYSVLYMKAVKALQEAMERIETLEAKVSALEAN